MKTKVVFMILELIFLLLGVILIIDVFNIRLETDPGAFMTLMLINGFIVAMARRVAQDAYEIIQNDKIHRKQLTDIYVHGDNNHVVIKTKPKQEK